MARHDRAVLRPDLGLLVLTVASWQNGDRATNSVIWPPAIAGLLGRR